MHLSVTPPGAQVRVSPAAIARSLLASLPEAQRLAIAGAILGDAADPASALQLRSLSRLAADTAAELDRAAFLRREAR